MADDSLTKTLAKLQSRQRGAEVALPVETLLGMKAPYNPRRIEPQAMERLRASLREFGVADPVIVNVQTGHIVGGHQRVEAAKLEGIESMPVVVVDLTPDREMALNVALNNPKLAGEYVDEDLAAVFRMIAEAGGDADLTGFIEAERRAIADGWASDHDAVSRIAPSTDPLLATIVIEAPQAAKEEIRTAIFDLLQRMSIEGARVR